jgi:formylglycine-generating enzyme required for sulfatase activity
MLGFVEIPEGAFTMGSDDPEDSWAFGTASPAHPLHLETYYITRYPVTVDQFRVFVQASGYQPSHLGLEGLSNHPVVYVSWQDAMAYCDWLTKQFRSHLDTLPKPLAERLRDTYARVMLPSEAEWEKAARGPNGFFYPWGNEADPNRANYGDTGINTTSAIGCFPGGASIPYGVEDLSGNVAEWTRSIQEDYPYPHDIEGRTQREDLQSSGDELRVRRGGAFRHDPQDVRCAVRLVYDARLAHYYVGFRVVLSSLP